MMNSVSLGKHNVVRKCLVAVFAAVASTTVLAQSWSFENNLLTGADGMVLTAKLSGSEVTVTGVSDAKGLTTIDLRGQVTGPNGEAYTIVEASGINMKGLKELYLPETIRTLCSFASNATLEKVEPFLPASLTSVPSFKQCKKLTGDLKLSNSKITTISLQYFLETAITSVDFGECPINTIGNYAFKSCKSLKTVTPFLPPTVSSVGVEAFRDCSALEGDLKFGNANLKSTGTQSFQATKITSVDFGNSPVETIAGSFSSCGAITNITPFLPPTVKNLGTANYAFGNKAGSPWCKVAEVLHLNSPDLKSIPFGCFMNMPITGLDLTGCGVSSIAENAFNSCTALTSVDPFLPASVSTVGPSAFYNCPVASEQLTMSCQTAGTIGKNAFNGLTLSRIILHEANITSIGENAFVNCKAKKLTLPASLTSIDQKGVNGNELSEGCWFYGPKPNLGNWSLTASGGTCTGAYFFPKGDATWEDYLGDATQNTVTDLTTAEKQKFRTMFPSVRRIPKEKVKIENSGSQQYLCWWNLIPQGLMVIVR